MVDTIRLSHLAAGRSGRTLTDVRDDFSVNLSCSGAGFALAPLPCLPVTSNETQVFPARSAFSMACRLRSFSRLKYLHATGEACAVDSYPVIAEPPCRGKVRERLVIKGSGTAIDYPADLNAVEKYMR